MKKIIQLIFKKYNYEIKKIHWKNDFALLKDFPESYTPVVFDVGANIGNYSLKLLNVRSNIVIYSFEPFEESFEQLKSKFKNRNNIKLEPLAISNYKGFATFNINSSYETNSLLSRNSNANLSLCAGMQLKKQVEVAVTTIDIYCNENNISQIDILKIDVQGAEYRVLQGAIKMLESKAIKNIRIEVLFGTLYNEQEPFYKVLSHLEDLKYIFQGFIEPVYINGKLEWADAFFVAH